MKMGNLLFMSKKEERIKLSQNNINGYKCNVNIRQIPYSCV